MEETMYVDDVMYMNEDRYMDDRYRYEKMFDEQWKDVIGYESLYIVSDWGNIISLITGIELKPYIDKKGYCSVTLCKDGKPKHFKIHRLVGAAFIPNPLNKPEINHKSGIKTNNRAEDLEWSSAKENTAHAYQMGLINNQTRLPYVVIMYIKNNFIRYNKEFGARALARRFGVSDKYILKIVKPETDISLYIAV